jgi:hypothetical protein
MRIEVKNNPDALLAAAGYERHIRGWIKPLWKNPLSKDAKQYVKSHFHRSPDGQLIPNGRIKSHRFHGLIADNVIDLHFDHDHKGKDVIKKFLEIIRPEIDLIALLDETYERETQT